MQRQKRGGGEEEEKEMTRMTGLVKDTGIFFQREIKISRCELAGEHGWFINSIKPYKTCTGAVV